ncbi:MAG: GAF domain-containing protein [Taibaiella sp.]|nr:GAF domain-containing protein [Taibaiella sp.]
MEHINLIAPSETERLRSVKKFQNYNFNLNTGLADLLKLAAEICETPVAFLTLIDEDTQWFKVTRGMEVVSMPREASFCKYTILGSDVLEVPDPSLDERFAHLPLVANEPHIRFYAGAPLATEDGQNIGTLCVYDANPKSLGEGKKALLAVLARQAIHLIELELCLQLLEKQTAQIKAQNNVLYDIAFRHAHDFRAPLTVVMGVMNLIKGDDYESPKEYLLLMDEAIQKLDEKVYKIVESTNIAKNMYQVS